MNVRVRWAGLVATLFLASQACWAQDADTTAAKPLEPPIGLRPGRGAVGADAGGTLFLLQDDYSTAAQPRFSFTGRFRYVISPKLRWQISPFYTWSAYAVGEPIPFRDPQFPTDTTKDRVLTQVVGGNAQLQLLKPSGKWRWHVGAGPALYRVWIVNRRKVLTDPTTFERHRKLVPAAAAEVGAEHFLSKLTNTSIELAAATHFVLAVDRQAFPNGFNGNLGLVEVRVGANYYFDFNRKKPAAPALPAQP